MPAGPRVQGDAQGRIITIYNPYLNQQRLTTDGVDIDLHRVLPTQRWRELAQSSSMLQNLQNRRPPWDPSTP